MWKHTFTVCILLAVTVKTKSTSNLKSSVESTAYNFFLKFVLMVKANVISSFIFIQDHKLNMEKIQLFLDAFLNLWFPSILKNTFLCFTSETLSLQDQGCTPVELLSGLTQLWFPSIPCTPDMQPSPEQNAAIWFILYTEGCTSHPCAADTLPAQEVLVLWLQIAVCAWGCSEGAEGHRLKLHQLLCLSPTLACDISCLNYVSAGWKGSAEVLAWLLSVLVAFHGKYW